MAPMAERVMGIHRNILTLECVRMRSNVAHVAAESAYREEYKGYSLHVAANSVRVDGTRKKVCGLGYVTAAAGQVDLGVGS